MFRMLVYVGLIWLGWKLLKTIFRSMSSADPLKQKREYGTVEGEAKKPRVDFKDVQDAEFTEIKEKEHASK